MSLASIQNYILNSIKSDTFWRKTAWLGLGLLIFQTIYFLYLFIPEISDRWNDLKPILSKSIWAALILILLVMVYFFFLRKHHLIKKYSPWIFRSIISLYLLQWFFVILYWFINPPITFTQIGSVLSGYGLKRDHVSYNNISSNMKLAVLASEDQLFPDHDGFDIKAIKLALKYNKKRPGKVKGASTITQQVAKNLFLWQKRNFIRKGLEVYFTFMIETFWNKRKILSRYLNNVEMGPGIFGVQAAAKSYFNKDAKDLSRSEAAMIASCLPSPKKYTIKPMSGHVRARYDDIMVQMNNLEPDPDVAEIIK